MDPIILLLRLIVPLFIPRFPLAGGICAILLDSADWHVHFFPVSTEHYQELDKLLDIYYLSFEAYVAYHWKSRIGRRIALSLFFYRLIGVFLYELTQLRLLLFLFPNIFESFFLFYLGCKKLLKKEPKLSWKLATVGVGTITILKLIQEYPMHVQRLWQWQYVEVHLFGNILVFQYDNIFHQIGIILLLMVIFVVLAQKHPRLKNWWRKNKKRFF